MAGNTHNGERDGNRHLQHLEEENIGIIWSFSYEGAATQEFTEQIQEAIGQTVQVLWWLTTEQRSEDHPSKIGKRTREDGRRTRGPGRTIKDGQIRLCRTCDAPAVRSSTRKRDAAGHIQQEIADACGVSRGRIAHYIGDVLPRGTKGTRNASA
jgi:hypothetical protein